MCLPQQNKLKSINSSEIIKPINGYIYWHIREDKITTDMDKMKVVMAFENGFKILEKEFYPIQFKSTSDKAQASILIGFYKDNDKDLPSKFGTGTLAYAYANYGDKFINSSDMFFNDAYRWAELDNSGIEFNLKKVFVHECMHALGYDHSNFKEDILYWQYQSTDDIIFTDDTRKAIRDRYGAEMAKIGSNKTDESINAVIDFCKNNLKIKENRHYIPMFFFKATLEYFGQIPEKFSLKVKSQLIKYLYGE